MACICDARRRSSATASAVRVNGSAITRAVAGGERGDQASVGLGDELRGGGDVARVELGEAVEGDVVGGGGEADGEVVHGRMVPLGINHVQ